MSRGLELKFGNHKLGDDTAIFNMGTAKDCPARALGLCEAINKGIKCYAEKAEVQYPKTVPAARKRQELFWKNSSVLKIIEYLNKKINNRRKDTKYLRFNESGDLWNQEDVDKLSKIAEFMKLKEIITYGYTARSDLDFTKANFLVKGSGNDKGNNGRTTIIRKNDEVPAGYIECPGGAKGCARCNLCKIDTKLNIAFRQH